MTPNLLSVASLIGRVIAAGVKRPALLLAAEVGNLDLRLRVKPTRRARNVNGKELKGWFEVADQQKKSKVYGLISPEGEWRNRHYMNLKIGDGVANELQKLGDQPAASAAKYGKLTGRCCFCGRMLSDTRSVAAGYGPDCAAMLSLPWGEHQTGVTTMATRQPKPTGPKWSEPKHPGDAVRIQLLTRGEGKQQELGDLRIQHYGPDTFHVCNFLPGIGIELPGDTPKTEPEWHTWCDKKAEADRLFDARLLELRGEGWRDYDPNAQAG